MSNLNEYTLARNIWRYAGKKLEYIDLTGKKGSGTLVGMQVHEETRETIALFRNSKVTNILPCLFPPTKVPLRQVILPSTQGSTRTSYSTGTRGESTKSSAQKYKHFQYYNNFYVITYMRNFKTGDEVVWTRYSFGDTAYLGLIVVTAERQDTGNQDNDSNYQDVAIIKFEVTPFTQTGEKAPGYFAYLPGLENTFLIPMRELLKLSEWIAVTAKVEDKSHRDLWQEEEAIQGDMDGDTEQLNIKTDKLDNLHHNDCLLTPPWTTQRSYSRNDLGRPLENAQLEGTSPTYLGKPLKPKSFHESMQSSNDTHKFSLIWENEWLLPINQAKFSSKIQQGGGFGVGVQGKNNSCYMDASLVALFSFNKTFDSCLHQLKDEENDKLTSRVKKIMRNDIILSMRKEFHVPHEKIFGLGAILNHEINRDDLSKCMDVEEFLTGLFLKMNTPPLLNYDDGDGDYIHQIALPLTWKENPYVPYLTVQSLLEKSFKTFNVKLTTLPHGGLIVKLPVLNGTFISCTGVIPNLTLDLTSIVSSSTDEDEKIMNLRSVICMRDNHFVAFVRTGLEKNSPWIYMDSNPVMCAYVIVLPDVDKCIEQALEKINSAKPSYNDDIPQPGCQQFSLFKNSYICLYV